MESCACTGKLKFLTIIEFTKCVDTEGISKALSI
jgi:hypothetical protein